MPKTPKNPNWINLSNRPFLLVNLVARSARMAQDVRNEKTKIAHDALLLAHEEQRAITVEEQKALRAELSKVEPATPTHRPIGNVENVKRHEARARLKDERARAAYLRGLRVAPVDKKAAKKAWQPSLATKTRKMRSRLGAFETVTIVDRIKPVHLSGANVIIDILRSSLIKSNITQDSAPQNVVDHFLSKYQNECKSGIDKYLSKMASSHLSGDAVGSQINEALGA